MSITSKVRISALVAALTVSVGGTAGQVMGQSLSTASGHDAANMLYSQGVHAYFAGNSAQAERTLGEALAVNPHDPRVYYFRALTLMRLGRQPEAEAHMRTGAALEAQRPSRFAIGRALERVQGANRLTLERFRNEARVDQANLRAQRSRDRYEHMTARESEVLRSAAPLSMDTVFPSAGGEQAPAVAGPAIFGPATPPPTFAPAPADSGTPAPADASDPFADDLRDTQASPPVAAPPAAARPAAPPVEETEESDPFGVSGGASESDPFGFDLPDEPAASGSPFSADPTDEDVPADSTPADEDAFDAFGEDAFDDEAAEDASGQDAAVDAIEDEAPADDPFNEEAIADEDAAADADDASEDAAAADEEIDEESAVDEDAATDDESDADEAALDDFGVDDANPFGE